MSFQGEKMLITDSLKRVSKRMIVENPAKRIRI
jgi:hypothetical protein